MLVGKAVILLAVVFFSLAAVVGIATRRPHD